jgi:NAD(P)-dependent dehydrogenase (short-subunit alcohol dehydrogenase family)
MQKYVRINIIVNKVGNTKAGTAATMSEETWNKQMDIILNSVYLSCHTILPNNGKERPRINH